MNRVLDLGDLPALLAGSRLPDHLRGITRADEGEPQEPQETSDDEGQP